MYKRPKLGGPYRMRLFEVKHLVRGSELPVDGQVIRNRVKLIDIRIHLLFIPDFQWQLNKTLVF